MLYELPAAGHSLEIIEGKAHRVEVDQFGEAQLAHYRNGLVHAARFCAHKFFTLGGELCHFLQA